MFEEYVLRSAQSSEGRHVLELHTGYESRSRVKAPGVGRQMMQAERRTQNVAITLAMLAHTTKSRCVNDIGWCLNGLD